MLRALLAALRSGRTAHVVKLLVACGLIGLLCARLDLHLTAEHIMRIGLAGCALGIAINLLQIGVLACRWQRILHSSNIRIPLHETLRIVFIGTFFNLCLPTSLGGDAVRVFMLHRRGTPLKNSTNAVLVDRLSGVAALLLLLLAALPLIGAWAPHSAFFIGTSLITAVLGLGLAVYFLGDWLLALAPGIRRWGVALRLAEASAYARRITCGDPAALGTMVLAIIVQLLSVALVATLAFFMHTPLSPLQAVVLVPPVMAAALLPISFGGWGTREVAMVAGLAIAGVPPSAALAISFLLGLLLLAASLPGGVLWLLGRGRSETASTLAEGSLRRS